MKIAVLMGGTSTERDVSLASGLRIAQALRGRGHSVVSIDTTRGALDAGEETAVLAKGVLDTEPPKLDALQQIGSSSLTSWHDTTEQARDADIVFLALHGGQGEDGTVQALLDLTSVPYTGSGILGSALAMDKDLSKKLFQAAGVPTPKWLMAPASIDAVKKAIGFPVIVKPSKQGSTVGLSIVREPAALAPAITEAFKYDDEVMIEEFIPGRELTVGVLGAEALPVGEIKPKHEIYDYACKYTKGMAVEEFPAKLSSAETAEVQRLSLAAFRALKLRGYARIDFRMSPEGIFYCLEANTLPGMTELSLIPQAAAACGIPFPELCERIVHLALSAGKEK